MCITFEKLLQMCHLINQIPLNTGVIFMSPQGSRGDSSNFPSLFELNMGFGLCLCQVMIFPSGLADLYFRACLAIQHAYVVAMVRADVNNMVCVCLCNQNESLVGRDLQRLTIVTADLHGVRGAVTEIIEWGIWVSMDLKPTDQKKKLLIDHVGSITCMYETLCHILFNLITKRSRHLNLKGATAAMLTWPGSLHLRGMLRGGRAAFVVKQDTSPPEVCWPWVDPFLNAFWML